MLRVTEENKEQALQMKFDLDKKLFAGDLREQEPMSRHTSWKTGGPAELYFSPADLKDLVAFMQSLPEDMPVTWLGKGSNLLVRDGGIAGAVISVDGVLDQCELVGDTGLQVGAGLACVKAARTAGQHGLAGIEFLAGIPGTLGGALAMNAGAWGGEMWRHVQAVETINHRGELQHYDKSDFNVGYRSVSLPTGEWFISARLELVKDDRQAVQARIRNMLSERAAAQPLGQLSCGSVFRNPDKDYAARLIEDCDLKGYAIGGACVSEKHANFIINTGQATSADIEMLIETVQSTVQQKHGIELIPEVRIIGKASTGGSN